MRQQFQSLYPFAAGILRPHGQRGAAERRLPQPELDRPEGQVQQHRIGQLAPGKCTWPVGCLPRYLSKDLSCSYMAGKQTADREYSVGHNNALTQD